MLWKEPDLDQLPKVMVTPTFSAITSPLTDGSYLIRYELPPTLTQKLIDKNRVFRWEIMTPFLHDRNPEIQVQTMEGNATESHFTPLILRVNRAFIQEKNVPVFFRAINVRSVEQKPIMTVSFVNWNSVADISWYRETRLDVSFYHTRPLNLPKLQLTDADFEHPCFQ